MRMDIRQKIDALLQKITSEDQLKRIYRFVKYIYILRSEKKGIHMGSLIFLCLPSGIAS